MTNYKNIERFEAWLKDVCKKYDGNIDVYLEEVDSTYCANGCADYEISGYFTKSGNPECYRYEVEDVWSEDFDELLEHIYIF
jgi:hypothetical protein